MWLIIDEIIMGGSFLGMLFILLRAVPRMKEIKGEVVSKKESVEGEGIFEWRKIASVIKRSVITLRKNFFKRKEKVKIEKIKRIKEKNKIGKDDYWDKIVKKIKK